MATFGLQNQVIRKTPAGYIDSAFLDGNDGSDVFPSWNISSFPNLLGQVVGTAFSVDLAQFLTDPGSPSSQIGFHTVSGQSPSQAGYTLTGTVLSNSNAVATSGAFQLVAVRKNVSVLSGPISFSIVAPIGVDNIPPTVPTGITAAAGTASGSLVVAFDPPCDIAPGVTPASGTTGVNIYINGAVSSPPSPIVSPANALAAPTAVNIGSMSNPFIATQSQKTWTLSAQGTGIASTSSEQAGFLDFGSFSSSQRFVAKLDSYTSSASTSLMGLMIHETAAAGGKFLAVGLGPSNGTTGLYVISRATASTASSQVATQLTDSNGAAITGPVYIKISRATDLQTVTLSYSLNENNWIVFYTATIPMNSSVHYGAFITSQNGSVYVSGNIEEISLSNAARISSTLTFSSSNPVNVQLQSLDAAGNQSALSTILVGIPARIQQQGHVVGFNPGNYMVSNSRTFASNANQSQRNTEIDLVKASSTVKGYMPYYQWPFFEPTTLGVYTWTNFDSDYRRLTYNSDGTRTGKMFVFELMMDAINSLTGSNIVPAYIFSNPGTYGTGLNSGGGTANGGGNGVVALWRTAVMDRIVALIQAISNHVMPSGLTFNNDPYCEGVISWELTSQTAAIGSSDANMTNITAQVQRWGTAAVATLPNTLVALECNYFGSPAQTLAMMQWMQANRLGFGGPDIWGATMVRNQAIPSNHTSANNLTWGQQCFIGVSTTTYPAGGADMRGTMPCMHEIQEPEMDGVQFSGLGAPFTPQDIMDDITQILSFRNAQGDLVGVTHAFWACLDPGVNKPAIQDPNTKKNIGTLPGNWGSVQDMINNNATLSTVYPSNLP